MEVKIRTSENGGFIISDRGGVEYVVGKEYIADTYEKLGIVLKDIFGEIIEYKDNCM